MVNEHWNWLSSIWREEDCDGNSLANIDAKRLGYVQVTIESTDINMEQDEVAVQVITQGLLSQARRQVLAIAAPVSGKFDHQVLSVEARLATSPSSCFYQLISRSGYIHFLPRVAGRRKLNPVHSSIAPQDHHRVRRAMVTS
jgi:hypothetical protein